MIQLPHPADRTKLVLVVLNDDCVTAYELQKRLIEEQVPTKVFSIMKENFSKALLRDGKNCLLRFLIGGADERVLIISTPMRDQRDFEWIDIRLQRVPEREVLVLDMSGLIHDNCPDISCAIKKIEAHFSS